MPINPIPLNLPSVPISLFLSYLLPAFPDQPTLSPPPPNLINGDSSLLYNSSDQPSFFSLSPIQHSSLALELLLRFNSRYSVLFFLLISALFIYKISSLAYPVHVLCSEALIIFLFGPVEALRISWARHGNLTESTGPLLFSLLLGLAVASICVYAMLLQTQVALVEQIGAGVELALVGAETLAQIAAMVAFPGR